MYSYFRDTTLGSQFEEEDHSHRYRLLVCRKCGQPYVEGFVVGDRLLPRKPENGLATRQVFLLGESRAAVEDEEDSETEEAATAPDIWEFDPQTGRSGVPSEPTVRLECVPLTTDDDDGRRYLRKCICCGGLVVVCSPASGSTFPLGATTVTCTATDASTNSSACTFTVTVMDTTPPIVNCPSSITAEATSEAGALVTYAVSVADSCNPNAPITCLPPSGGVFHIGATSVNCTALDMHGNSAFCTFTVTVLGARGINEDVLGELIALRATVMDRDDARKLDEAIERLNKSLAAELWVGQTHLDRKHGNKVFQEQLQAIRKLCEPIRSRRSNLPDAILQGFVERIYRASRLLASIAIQEALAAGVATMKIDQALKDLAKGDAADSCDNRIEDYRRAWNRAAPARVSPPMRLTNGHVRLEIVGEAGEPVVIQASVNLRDWATIGTRTANAEGVVTFEDADAGRYPTRYYRVQP